MDETPSTAGMARRQQFEEDVAKLKVKTGGSGSEATWAAVGVVLMIGGAVVALASFIASGSISDTRDVLSTVILAVFGLCVVVTGAAVFLRYSFSRFLRFWLLRLIYEQQGGGEG